MHTHVHVVKIFYIYFKYRILIHTLLHPSLMKFPCVLENHWSKIDLRVHETYNFRLAWHHVLQNCYQTQIYVWIVETLGGLLIVPVLYLKKSTKSSFYVLILWSFNTSISLTKQHTTLLKVKKKLSLLLKCMVPTSFRQIMFCSFNLWSSICTFLVWFVMLKGYLLYTKNSTWIFIKNSWLTSMNSCNNLTY